MVLQQNRLSIPLSSHKIKNCSEEFEKIAEISDNTTMVAFATINQAEERDSLDINVKGEELECRARSPNAVFDEICGPTFYSPRSEVEDELLLDKTTLSDVDELLLDKNEADAADYMRHMIADLLNEVEVLKIKLEESQQEVSALKQQRRAMQLEVSPRRKYSMNSNSKKITLSTEQANNISVHDATCLVVANLTKKVEDLNFRQDELMSERNSLVERVEDLTCQNSAYELKISALEHQFKSINKTRQKAVQRLIDTSVSYSTVHVPKHKSSSLDSNSLDESS
jgi:dsDNA-binding SOS-regulon protein